MVINPKSIIWEVQQESPEFEANLSYKPSLRILTVT